MAGNGPVADKATDDEFAAVVAGEVIIDESKLTEIKSFEDALALIEREFGGDVTVVSDVIGTGFGVADEKSAFVGVEMIVVKADKHDSTKTEKGYFWSLHCVAKDGRKVIINDGGSGICEQMDELAARHPERIGKPMLLPKGLRVSNYNHPVHGPSVTYYLDTSARV